MCRSLQPGSRAWQVRACVNAAGKPVTAAYVAAELDIDVSLAAARLTTLWRRHWVERCVGESERYEYTRGLGPTGRAGRRPRLELLLIDLLAEVELLPSKSHALRAAARRARRELSLRAPRTRRTTRAPGTGGHLATGLRARGESGSGVAAAATT
jgi:hypothetical protein